MAWRNSNTPSMEGYWFRPSRIASLTASIKAGSQPKSGKPCPKLTAWCSVAKADMTVKMVVPELGRRREASAAHALERLGWKTRDEATTVLDCAHSLIEKGLVKA